MVRVDRDADRAAARGRSRDVRDAGAALDPAGLPRNGQHAAVRSGHPAERDALRRPLAAAGGGTGEAPYSATTGADGVTWHFELLGWRTPAGTFSKKFVTAEQSVGAAELYGKITVDTNTTSSALTIDGATPTAPVLRMTTSPAPQTGGTVTFTDDGAPIAGCTSVPAGTADGVTTCSPPGLSPGSHTFAGRFDGGVGYAASAAAGVTHVVPAPPPPPAPPGGGPALVASTVPCRSGARPRRRRASRSSPCAGCRCARRCAGGSSSPSRAPSRARRSA